MVTAFILCIYFMLEGGEIMRALLFLLSMFRKVGRGSGWRGPYRLPSCG